MWTRVPGCVAAVTLPLVLVVSTGCTAGPEGELASLLQQTEERKVHQEGHAGSTLRHGVPDQAADEDPLAIADQELRGHLCCGLARKTVADGSRADLRMDVESDPAQPIDGGAKAENDA